MALFNKKEDVISFWNDDPTHVIWLNNDTYPIEDLNVYPETTRLDDLLIYNKTGIKNEKFTKTKNKSILIVKPKIESYKKLSKSLTNLINLAKNEKLEDCFKEMSTIVPEYKKTKVENLQNKRVVQQN